MMFDKVRYLTHHASQKTWRVRKIQNLINLVYDMAINREFSEAVALLRSVEDRGMLIAVYGSVIARLSESNEYNTYLDFRKYVLDSPLQPWKPEGIEEK